MSSLPVPVSLDSTLRHLGSADPRRPFLIDAREPERPLEYTWGDADRQVDALAEQIAAHACRSVGVLLDNSYRNLCLIYAVMRAGKHLVLIDPEWGEAAKQAIVDEMRLDADLQAAFQRDYAALANIYGLSECGFAFLFGKRRGDAFDNSVGPAVGLELKLTDPDGRPLEGSGERGRLWVRTPSLFSGYVNRPDLTAQVLEDGWLNTQDLAYFDEDRCVHVLGRCDGTINKGGNLFHLNECERALNGLDEVIDVCCLKVDCPLYGEDYVAVIHTAPQVEFAFLPWLQQQLGTLRAPQRVVLSHQALPLNGAGKHDRRALAALLQREAS
ncbi:AMP-binding protein [Pseudomonas aeruginosa]|uniref:ANL family adenylate-forming protein n=1 Tax=Pseudomonas aeruginosa TaxID=287 RepID=UPI001C9D7022|nr:fatty acid--CoA ligase family protein [Pseudomonas aeruginosa]MBY9090806.1 AMP-binding protein [Pseudomonas aeruginosa]MBY9151998.1 AMP-binding protein [Pseudomonas aeruginosa]MBY9228087.1 AMP-binding protein [Pseudomonas aeruginosa]MBY9272981.1 AMP-binding protein [Pseudomonas aeruginosa]MBY9778680.1 AMP-binding protein [Pseudomonas aeruginosa]